MSPLLLSFLLLPVPLQGTDREIVWQLDGTKTDELMGWQMDLYGDWDWDGTPDLLVVGGTSDNPIHANGGAIHIVSGESGAILKLFGPLQSMYVPWGGYSFLEASVLAMPNIDLDGDGFPEFIHIAPYCEYDSSLGQWVETQAVYMRRGFNGEALWVTKLPNVNPFEASPCVELVDFGIGWNGIFLFVGGTDEQGHLLAINNGVVNQAWDYSNDPNIGGWGSTMASGDFDGDGDIDFAVGAPFSSTNGLTGNGEVFVFDSPSGAPLSSFSGSHDGAQLGSFLICPGDLNGNGIDALGIAHSSGPGLPGVFEVYEASSSMLMYSLEFFLDTDELGFRAQQITILPDMDGDGKDDWLHLIPSPYPAAPSVTSLRVSSSADGGAIGNEMPNPYINDLDGMGFGFNLVAFPDVNENNHPEIIATSHLAPAWTPNNYWPLAGSVYRFDAFSSGGGSPGSGEQSSPGGSWGTHGSYSGSGAGGQAGHSIASLGADWDGDGTEDVILGVPFGGPNGEGQVQVISGASWSLLFPIDPPLNAGAATFGWAVDSMGDMDGDGFPEIAIGAPNSDTQGYSQAGMVWIFESSTGSLLTLGRTSVAFPQQDAGFGFALANIGDADGDGINDLVVGEPFWDSSGGGVRLDTGRFSMFSGLTRQGGFERSVNYNLYGRPPHCGYSVSAVGDYTDGQGNVSTATLVVGVPGSDDLNGSDRGHVVVCRSSGPGQPLQYIYGSASGDQSGDQVVGDFDWNLDGIPDLAMGIPGLDDWGAMLGAGNNVGGVRIHSMGSGAVLTEVRGDAEGGRMGGSSGGDISIGDVNGDGSLDIVVGQGGVTGSLRSPNPDAGMITIYSGLTDSIVYRRMGTAAGDFLGEAAQVVGDLDGDGIADIASGAPLADFQGLVDAGVVVAEVFDPYIRTQTTSLSASTFTSLRWELDFPASYSTYKYHTLISESGTGPSTIGSLEVPLTLDQRMWDTIFGDYPTDNNWIGPLNASGDATIVQGVPAGAAVSFIGKTLYLAVVLHKRGRAPVLSSTVMPLTILP